MQGGSRRLRPGLCRKGPFHSESEPIVEETLCKGVSSQALGVFEWRVFERPRRSCPSSEKRNPLPPTKQRRPPGDNQWRGFRSNSRCCEDESREEVTAMSVTMMVMVKMKKRRQRGIDYTQNYHCYLKSIIKSI